MALEPRPLDPVLLRSFLKVSETHSFTEAARQLGLQQSSVSQHVARLEKRVGRRLLARDTHEVRLTPDGDAILPLARQVLEAGNRIERYLKGSTLRGRLRLGVSEDFAFTALPDILAEFAMQHHAVDLELTVGLSGLLYEKYDAGDLDLIFAKRRKGDERGEVAWQERLVWVGRPGSRLAEQTVVPLVLYPPPSITRVHAIETLERAGRAWRVACTSDSLAGLRAATVAGLGVTAHSARLIPPGLVEVEPKEALPRLGSIEFVVVGGQSHKEAERALAASILSGTSRLLSAAATERRSASSS
ncbi:MULTISPECIES: LysR substrate-binding domain-containing protein [unclassified Beijerinckia]|uniref:LysR substrate-binding domain-containing protein n=1 Tax=unclassified Beijerinckia TaxID=2638183 RepID=UPI0008968556|nr:MULTISPECIES: LysR substrate-binding domain-containing protein [unclassified Beijerinckia]MDH7796590.1 DNA-binding transcriptional LysR family regulator [Beijerinckia sp. GAS462]SEC51594.1 DNA-binding transcriptional regulator, LysR family [Beijerinckia sp. 28-YEA-48]